jgi:hypothetical protein
LLFDGLRASLAPVDEPLFRAVHRQRIEMDWKFGAGEGIRTPDPNLGKTAPGALTGGFPRILEGFCATKRGPVRFSFPGSCVTEHLGTTYSSAAAARFR